ncbi:MAG: MBL fold metallo-hydrolase [Crocinitomicaceae bacterium]|nr:MBL fold metallo-hydrolase [Crocinitomicaceae bacterium]MBP6033061.1 MBL fold metallo-hydrolase [Crocinitomicaceae bacterium]
MSVHVSVFPFNAFQENTIVVSNDQGEAIIFDPGCYSKDEENELSDFIAENELSVLAVLYTHAHIDHILGAAFVQKRYNAPAYLHKLDHETWNSVASYAHVYGFEGYQLETVPAHSLEDGQELQIGSFKIHVRHTPGHAPGHVVYYFEEDKFIINGDVLFKGSFGRVDLPGGNLETLKSSIFNILFKYPEETVVYCGHGPETTIGQEKRTNYIHQF